MDYNKFVGKELKVVKDGYGFTDESFGDTYKVLGYEVNGYRGYPGFKVEGYTNGGIGYVGVESFDLTEPEMEDWCCKPKTKEEAIEIVDRAVANGAMVFEVVTGGALYWDNYSWDLCSHWGVFDGETYTGDADDPDSAFYNKTELTIEQVREKFPLDSDAKQEGQWITITNPSDIKKLPVGSKIRIDGVENVLVGHYGCGDNGFDTQNVVNFANIFSSGMWDEGYTVEYLLEAPVEHTESVSGGTDATLPVSEKNDVEASTDCGEVHLEWPIDRSLEGRKVRFNGFTDQRHCHWRYEEGKVYEIGIGKHHFGPRDKDGDAPYENYGFDFTLLPEDYCECVSGDLGRDEDFVEAVKAEKDLVKQPNHYMLFPEHSLEVKHINKRVLDRIEVSDMDLSLNQAGWLQQALQYLLRCYAKGGKQDIEKAKEALEVLLSEESNE